MSNLHAYSRTCKFSFSFTRVERIGLKDLVLSFCVIYVLVLFFLPSKKARLQQAPKKVKKFISTIYEINPVYSLSNLSSCAICSTHSQGLSFKAFMDLRSLLFSASTISIQAVRATLTKALTSQVLTELSLLLSPTSPVFTSMDISCVIVSPVSSLNN